MIQTLLKKVSTKSWQTVFKTKRICLAAVCFRHRNQTDEVYHCTSCYSASAVIIEMEVERMFVEVCVRPCQETRSLSLFLFTSLSLSLTCSYYFHEKHFSKHVAMDTAISPTYRFHYKPMRTKLFQPTLHASARFFFSARPQKCVFLDFWYKHSTWPWIQFYLWSRLVISMMQVCKIIVKICIVTQILRFVLVIGLFWCLVKVLCMV